MNWGKIDIDKTNGITVGNPVRHFKKRKDKIVGFTDDGKELRVAIWLDDNDSIISFNIYET